MSYQPIIRRLTRKQNVLLRLMNRAMLRLDYGKLAVLDAKYSNTSRQIRQLQEVHGA